MAFSNMKRKKYEEARGKVKIGSIFVTRYEKARIIGARALQISLGAPVLVSIRDIEKDALKIAERELYEGVLPLTIRRTLPSGDYQDVPLEWLVLES
ncbi:MAG: DNA-directed RNA polymerase subunit K [Promethearchaeota archaeon]